MHAAISWLEMFEKVKSNLERCFAGEDLSYTDWFTNPLGPSIRTVTYSPCGRSRARSAVLLITHDLTEHMRASELCVKRSRPGSRQPREHNGRANSVPGARSESADAAAITDANTCLRWLTRDLPDLYEARAAASRA